LEIEWVVEMVDNLVAYLVGHLEVLMVEYLVDVLAEWLDYSKVVKKVAMLVLHEVDLKVE
jgi:hypothetical protein